MLKKVYVVEFHNHLNSANPNIQFIKEVKEESRLVWRDTSVLIKN